MKKIYFLLLICMLGRLNAQSIEDFLDSYEGENSIPYIQPLADLFTANLHSGIRERSLIDTGLYFHVGLIVMNSYPSSSQKTFTGKTDADFEPEQTAVVPTIIGSNEPVTVQGVNGTAYVFAGGYNLRALPLASPQLTIGGLFNSEITGRYFAFDLEDELGTISLFGLGFRHGLNSYLPTIPFDLSVGYMYHQFTNKPHFEFQSHLASVHCGKTGKWWSAQIILGYQNSTTRVKYSYEQNEQIKNIDLTLKNEYSIMAELSGAIHFSVINLHGAINYSGPLTVALGLGLRF